MKLNAIIFFLLSLLIAAGSAAAQTANQQVDKDNNRHYLYEWKDEKGMVHITDDLGDVPEKYRPSVRKRAEPPHEQGAGREIQGGAVSPPVPGQENEQNVQKAEWQGRIKEWTERLANAEKRYKALDEERSTIIMRWGVPANAPPAYRTRAVELDEEMKQVQKEIDDARNMINVVIPEEARKAGVPPGWLRE